jgi:hypothetical protein
MNQTEILKNADAALEHLYQATHWANVLGSALLLWAENNPDIYGSGEVAYEIKSALIKATEHLGDLKGHLHGWQRRNLEAYLRGDNNSPPSTAQ